MLDFKVLQYLTKKCFKILGKIQIIKDPAGIVIMTYKFLFKVLPSCSTLLGNKFLYKKIINLFFILLLISKGSTSQYGDVPYHLKQVRNDSPNTVQSRY